MKIFILCLAVLCPLALGTPGFWSLVRMAWAAEPVGYVEADGSTRWATIGPKSFWPDWAVRPENTGVEVDSYFGASATTPAMGMASVTFRGEQKATAEAYEALLKANGFAVTRYGYETWSPDLPPERFTLCMIEGVQEAASPKRTLRFSFAVNSRAMPPKLHWTEGEPPPAIGMQPSDCFSAP